MDIYQILILSVIPSVAIIVISNDLLNMFGNTIGLIVSWIIFSCMLFLMLYLVNDAIIKETYIKCLTNENPYRMEINYKLQDSVYIPIDTTYVKTNEN